MGELIPLVGHVCPEEASEQTLCFDDLRVHLAAAMLRLSDQDAALYTAHLKEFMRDLAAVVEVTPLL